MGRFRSFINILVELLVNILKERSLSDTIGLIANLPTSQLINKRPSNSMLGNHLKYIYFLVIGGINIPIVSVILDAEDGVYTYLSYVCIYLYEPRSLTRVQSTRKTSRSADTKNIACKFTSLKKSLIYKPIRECF